MEYQLSIYEKAISKERPRFNMHLKRTYTPYRTKQYEDMIKLLFCQKYGFKVEPSENEIYIKIDVEYAPPKTYSKKKKQMLINGRVGYTQKPDCDNIAKAILDALNGVIWVDDKQIVDLRVSKHYGEKDKINIEIRSIEDEFKSK